MNITNWTICCLLLTAWSISSCETLKESSKYKFNDGFYTTNNAGHHEKVYVLAGSDTIKEYQRSALQGMHSTDSIKSVRLVFPDKKPKDFTDHVFRQGAFDIDVLTVLFKYRPPASNFPPQLNATFNGAVYTGYRTDIYRLSYKQTPLHDFRRKVSHYGFSAGIFSGLGTARIDEYVTNNALAIQYDGMVNLTGLALILAADRLTAGITLGEDHLLDRNHQLWVNNGKVWIGLSLGLNLN